MVPLEYEEVFLLSDQHPLGLAWVQLAASCF